MGNVIMPKTDDVVHINTGLLYKGYDYEYDAIVLWNGFNRQPLITKVGQYLPHWSTYEEIECVIGHIDLESVVKWDG